MTFNYSDTTGELNFFIDGYFHTDVCGQNSFIIESAFIIQNSTVYDHEKESIDISEDGFDVTEMMYNVKMFGTLSCDISDYAYELAKKENL